MIIDTRLRASVRLHDILHEFYTGRGKEMAVLSLNMVQDLAIMDQDSL